MYHINWTVLQNLLSGVWWILGLPAHEEKNDMVYLLMLNAAMVQYDFQTGARGNSVQHYEMRNQHTGETVALTVANGAAFVDSYALASVDVPEGLSLELDDSAPRLPFEPSYFANRVGGTDVRDGNGHVQGWTNANPDVMGGGWLAWVAPDHALGGFTSDQEAITAILTHYLDQEQAAVIQCVEHTNGAVKGTGIEPAYVGHYAWHQRKLQEMLGE